MLQDETHYEIIKELFKKGLIRVSRYGEVRTASQYVQNAIAKNLASNKDRFIFSVLPVKSSQKFLLRLMQQVLVNADLEAIREYVEMQGEEEQKVLALFDEYNEDGLLTKVNTIGIEITRIYLKLLDRFLELILSVSMYEVSSNVAIAYESKKYEEKDFCFMMDKMIALESEHHEAPLWKQSVTLLKEIKCQVENGVGKNNRSVWIKELKKLESTRKKEVLQYAELIVNLCYNYTVELSIYGVSRHYEREALECGGNPSFKNEVFSRLKNDWNNGVGATEKFLQEETNTYENYRGEYPDWNRGMKIILRRKLGRNRSDRAAGIPLYEYRYKKS